MGRVEPRGEGQFGWTSLGGGAIGGWSLGESDNLD